LRAVKRVALVITELRPGGAERVVVNLAGALQRCGVQPMVVCLQHEGQLAEEVRSAGIRLVALNSLRGYDFGAIFRLARVLREFKPNVIHVHDRSSLPYAVLANRLSGRRPVVFSGHGLLIQAAGRSRWRDRLGIGGVSAVTVVAEPAVQEYAKVLGWRGEIDVVANGIVPVVRDETLRRAVRAELGLPDDTFAFLSVGNVKPEKGFEDLIGAASLLRKQAGGRSFAAIIVGGRADEEYCRRLDALAADLGEPGLCRFLGFRQDTRALYSAADAFVLPSRKEGLPMVLLEAMSAGLPVVATRVGGVPDVIRHGENGLLVSPAAPGELAEAMGRFLADDGALRQKLGPEATRCVRDSYGTDTMAARYLEIYGRIVSSRCSEPTNRTGTKTRVLMLGPTPPLTGGMATVVDNLSHSPLAERCCLLVMNNGKTTAENRSLLVGIAAQLRLAGRLAANLRRHRPDIVHIHTCALFSFWRDIFHLLIVRTLGIKVVWHIHDGSFAGFMAQGSAVRRGVIRKALEAGATVIVLAESSLQSLQPQAPRVRWRIVPNGVPLPAEVAPPGDGTTRFLFLGNLTRRKGAFDLVDATEQVCSRGLDITVRLAGGETAPGQRDELVHHIDGLACRSRISLLGIVSGGDKDRALAESDCLVLPSYAEGLPMAVLEGMANGLPVIATGIGAIPYAVTEGQEGFLIEPGSVGDLAERMASVAQDRALRCRMGGAARARVEKEYSLAVVSDKIMGVYAEVASGNPG
jgi:glycosyltransferase involved in cell wall biosynthesis